VAILSVFVLPIYTYIYVYINGRPMYVRKYLRVGAESDTSFRYGEVGITVLKFTNRSVRCSSIDQRIFAFYKFYSV
jgi:hypothetical protein